MLTEEGLKFLMQLKDIEIVDHDGLQYSSRALHLIPEASPVAFATKSLAGIVELINKEHEHKRLNDLIIHIVDPIRVDVYSMLREDLGRFHLYSAIAELPGQNFGNYMNLETAIIRLKSTFVQTDARDKLIQVLGNIKEDAVKTSSDDGISQTVTAKTGIATVGNVKIEPIIKLAPYRTFIEVEQPEGEFLLRLRNGPEAALFEADGGAWKMQARKNIKEYFMDKLDDLVMLGKVIITE
ncbi:conserved hypothetical protein [Desulforamulus reducens MI-1]|uniref:Uncharacterized protein n=1 Tax=Desulforamulus reducens (strain ATCC BAA-1160 / DSM 100696 / MI-1) TaxID=349161 RepID=A4J3R7_DESRM|nr:hypothetical protein [Desulforamulus reducens]ABO49720.1 conserved hypothetical protein [Desulforamulus reducens MI-1]